MRDDKDKYSVPVHMDAEKETGLSWTTMAADDPRFAAAYAQCVYPSLLQSPLYARAVALAQNGRTRMQAVVLQDGAALAGTALLAHGRGVLARHVALDEGPCWLPDQNTIEHNAAFFAAFARSYPAGPTLRRRVIPALGNDSPSINMLNQNSFRHSAGSVSQTIWCDLAAAEDVWFASWTRAARNKIRKGERAGVRVEWDDSGRTADWLVRHEAQARRTKNYHGPSPRMLGALRAVCAPTGAMIVGRALLAGRAVAGVMFVVHGPAATWLIGWNGDAGRAVAAHNILLRDGYRILKQRGIRYLDLGGVNDGPARSVKQFKESLGGELFTQPGLYR